MSRILMASLSGITVTWIEWLPVAVRVLVGLATFVYICLKIYKLYNKWMKKNYKNKQRAF